MLISKVSSEDFQSMRQDYGKAIYDSQQRVTKQELQLVQEVLINKIEDTQKELLLKCSIKDLC
jgi:hypothetical protein